MTFPKQKASRDRKTPQVQVPRHPPGDIHRHTTTHNTQNMQKAARYALSLTPSVPTEAIHRPTKEMSLGYAPLKDKATQVGIEHLMEILNKPTDRGFLAYAHTTRVVTTYQHCLKESYEANQAKLPTLRVISYTQHIPGAELGQISSLQAPSQITISMRASTR